LIELAKRYDASLILDEAHSTGTFGPYGGGLATSLKAEHDIDVRIHTFGKAMGLHGAVVVGSKKLKDYLINFARPFIYTTALPLHSLVSIRCAFRFLNQNIGLQNLLRHKIDTYVSATHKIDNKTHSNSSIQTLIVPGNTNAKLISSKLQRIGFDIRPILSPTVQEGKERLRICLHTFNTDSDIVNLASELEQITNTVATKA
jgi:8-amino-7-oxononanoate synthase